MNIDRADFLQITSVEKPIAKNFRFETVAPSQLPAGILRDSGYVVDPNTIESAAMICHKNKIVTYRLTLSDKKSTGPSKITFLVDYFNESEVGYVRVDHSDKLSFARNIYTKGDFEQKGLGAQRLVMANQFCMNNYNQPLYSGLATLQGGRKLWKSLIKIGLVEPTGNLTNHMYRFKEQR